MPVTGQRVVRRALGRRLTGLRVASGKSRREVAEAKLGMSEPTLHRIETGKTPVTVANVRALCWLYGADQSVTDALAELALGTSQEEWWDANPVVPDWFKLYVGLEASAGRICCYEGELVPGELQIEAYARAVFAVEQPADKEAAERQVKLRMQRQQTLRSRVPPPRLTTVLGEGAVTRPVGGKGVLKAQIEHLRELTRSPTIEIRVLPWSVGAHAAMAGAFRILDFDDPEDPDVVYLESHVGALYLEEAAEVDEYRRVFDLISKDAVPVEEYR
jgi:transcriptional regulator with XRE-family HTH domain